MHIFRHGGSAFWLLALLGLAAFGCIKHVAHVEKFAINGYDADSRQIRTYEGAISEDPQLQKADITIRTYQNTVHCSGTISTDPGETAIDILPYSTILSCRDGKRLAVRWAPLAPGKGVMQGLFSNDRLILLTYGHTSLEQAKAAINKYFTENKTSGGQKKPDGKPDTAKPGNTPDGKPPSEKPGNADKAPEEKPEKKSKPRWTGNGTGFFVTDDGLLITNEHVVRDAVRIGVEDTFARKTYDAEVLAVDETNDLAVIRINRKSKGLPLGNSKAVRKGQDVLALGYPAMVILGKEQKATFGRINSLTGMHGNVTAFQSDATIYGGNSGGPLLNLDGEVIAVNSWGVGMEYAKKQANANMSQVSYSVKVDYVKALLATLPKEYKPLPRKGSKAASMAELVERCEQSVVIVWTEKKRARSRR